MIRSIIKEQLERCQFANLNNFDKSSATYSIRRYSKPTYDLNKCYLVKIPISIIGKQDSVLATNWNSGSAPTTEYLKIYISKKLGNMIFVDSISFDFEKGVDLPDMWSGWLDSDTLAQIACL